MKHLTFVLVASMLAAAENQEVKTPVIPSDKKISIASAIIKAQNDQLVADNDAAKARESFNKAQESFNNYSSALAALKKELNAENCEFDLVNQAFKNCRPKDIAKK